MTQETPDGVVFARMLQLLKELDGTLDDFKQEWKRLVITRRFELMVSKEESSIVDDLAKLVTLLDRLNTSADLLNLDWYGKFLEKADALLPAVDELVDDTPVSSCGGWEGLALLQFTTREMCELLDTLGLPTNTPPSRVKEALLERLKS